VIVCVPSGITPVERDAVEQATLDAGATRAFLIEEPLAAAIGAGLPVGDAIGSLIVDIGGGTSEMGITALGGLVVAHSIRVGGYELDDAIVHLLQDREMLLVGQGQAEAVKLEIGSADVGVEVPGTAEVAGRSLTTGLLRRAVVDADQIRSALSRPLAHIVDAVKNVLERTPARALVGHRPAWAHARRRRCAPARPRHPPAPRDGAADHRRRRAADHRRA
jgi:rod shape-determining protein MreB and related proteins